MIDLLGRLASQAEQAEVAELQSESTRIGFEANRLKSSQVREENSIAARVVRDGRLGFAASSDASALDRLADNTLESAQFGARIPIAFPQPQPAPHVATYDHTIVDLPIARLVEIGKQIIAYIREVEPTAQVEVYLTRGIQRLEIRNHTGAHVSILRSPLSISTDVTRVQGDDVLMVNAMLGTTLWQDNYMDHVHRLVAKLEQARRSAVLCSGKMPVLFAPRGALVLALPIAQALDGKSVYAGISPMVGKSGQRLFDHKITVEDDAIMDGGYASAAYDDEGVPHQRHTLIEKGVVRGFMYDLKTAAQAGAESTGSASRGLFGPPRPAPTNLIFGSGETPLADIVAGVDEGLLIEHVLGLGQINTISGAFSNSVSLAFRIVKGEVVGRVKDVSIAGNIYQLLQSVAAVSREREWAKGRTLLPYLLLENVNVVAATRP